MKNKNWIAGTVATVMCALPASIAHAQLAVPDGGTGLTSAPTGALLYGNNTNPMTALVVGQEGEVLAVTNGMPAWVSPLALPALHLQMNGRDIRLGSGISTQTGFYPSTIIGTDAYTNGGGYGHTALGWMALQQLFAGEWNIAIGGGAGADLGQGAGNTFMGGSAGTVGNTHEPWTGNFNTIIGFGAASNLSSASPNLNNNTIIGSYAADAQNLSGGDYNILLGSRINLPLDGGSHQLNIGNILFGIDISGTGYAISPGKIGIGTSVPTARFSVHENQGETNVKLFDITSSAAGPLQNLYSVDLSGHHMFGGPAPTLTNCGTGGSITGTDSRGRFTVGTGAGSLCAVVFAHAWPAVPVCQVTKESGPFRNIRVLPTPNGFTVTASGNIGADTFAYACDGI